MNVNLKKTKIIIFNRGNNLIKSKFNINNVILENVKTVKYLGFTITAKNCSFWPTLNDLSINAKLAIYALNSKIEIFRYPIILILKLFDTLIKPILLYGTEVWGPYTDFNYTNWDASKIEMTHTQFLKRALGCNFQTSNIMTRGEVGVRPLLIDVKVRIMNYIKSIKERRQSTVYSALEFERKNEVAPNFYQYLSQFNLPCDQETLIKSKAKIKIICQNNYD